MSFELPKERASSEEEGLANKEIFEQKIKEIKESLSEILQTIKKNEELYLELHKRFIILIQQRNEGSIDAESNRLEKKKNVQERYKIKDEQADNRELVKKLNHEFIQLLKNDTENISEVAASNFDEIKVLLWDIDNLEVVY